MCNFVNIKASDLEEARICLILWNVCKFGMYTVVTFQPVWVDDKHHRTDQLPNVEHYTAYMTGRDDRVFEPKFL